jgi:hypothetical protein
MAQPPLLSALLSPLPSAPQLVALPEALLASLPLTVALTGQRNALCAAL